MMNQNRDQSQSIEFENSYNQFDISSIESDNQTVCSQKGKLCQIAYKCEKQLSQCLIKINHHEKMVERILLKQDQLFSLKQILSEAQKVNTRGLRANFLSNSHQECFNVLCSEKIKNMKQKYVDFSQKNQLLLNMIFLAQEKQAQKEKLVQKIFFEQFAEPDNMNIISSLKQLWQNPNFKYTHQLRLVEEKVRDFLLNSQTFYMNIDQISKLNRKCKFIWSIFQKITKGNQQFIISDKYRETQINFLKRLDTQMQNNTI